MLKTFEASGKTVEEAIDKALLLANTTIENVDIEVLELGGKGVFGFGKKDARVRITQEVEDTQPEEESRAKARPPKPAKNRPEEKPLEPVAEDEAPVVKEMIRNRPAAATGEEAGKRGRGKDNKKIKNIKSNEAAPKEDTQEETEKEQKNKDNARPKDKPREKEQGNRTQREKPAAAERSERGERERGYRVSEGEEATNLTAEAQAFLNPIFASLKVEPELETHLKEGILWLVFSGQGLGSLIGRRGETLNALQYLTNLAVNRDKKDHVRLVLDVEGYRAGREETLVALAKKMADKAVRSGRRVELEPMNPHERRIVHIALQNDKRVDTISQGEEPYRRVVINRRRGEGGHKRRSGGGNRSEGAAQNQSQTQAQAPEKMSLSQQLGQQFSEQMDSR